MLVCCDAFSVNREPHGRRVQRKAIAFIAVEMEMYDAFGGDDDLMVLQSILVECHRKKCPDVNVRTLRRWWGIYIEWGELPYYAKKRKGRHDRLSKSTTINDNELLQLKMIVDRNPNLYLDEISMLFGMEMGKFLHYTTIWRYLDERLHYSQQVMTSLATQQCEEEEIQFRVALGLLLQGDVRRLITIDETHKDRNAARRRRGWAHRNSGGVMTREWFKNEVRYTLIAAADVNGFIPSACHTVMRDELSEEGAVGTVDGEYFLYWVKEYLCPMLGDYMLGEPRSVVLMDNASTHMSDDIQRAIEATGAVLIYGAPYSPHLNPIELYFGVYKSYLKRNGFRMSSGWYDVHLEGINEVDYEMGLTFFKKCGIPGSSDMVV